MSTLIQKLQQIWQNADYPFLIHQGRELRFTNIADQKTANIDEIKSGDVVALIGDFDPESISLLLQIIDKGAIIVPLTEDTKGQHDYFFEAACVDVVVHSGEVRRIPRTETHPLVAKLREQEHAGLILFSTGTTGRPKAILHDLTLFLKRFDTPRPTQRTINFLLFDHIGGINTLLHTLFNKGVVIAPESRTVDSILSTIRDYDVEVLPTTPTFLRMMLMSGAVPDRIPSCLKLITYGTERMDQPTLDQLCELLPSVDFRQTFGMSELGIVRAKSEARDSLFMRIGGEGVETKVVDDVLYIRSRTRMLGYMNAESPFDEEGWYNTKDIVEVKGEFFRVTGRIGEVINVGGLKFMASEVERVALEYPGVSLVKVIGRPNPISGQHAEMTVQMAEGVDGDAKLLGKFLAERLPVHMQPRRIRFESVAVGHRFKRS
ncbi:ANL family adenylate-forming protein [Sphingomonas elodea]|uniref:ANL family adenylate-forming protein n=1 Tax=Sphingomonas elodea TaxID=179878 RepID=UPI000263100E|nr:fatty acid--CoA ligase family protein [Sphingomonas elodea]